MPENIIHNHKIQYEIIEPFANDSIKANPAKSDKLTPELLALYGLDAGNELDLYHHTSIRVSGVRRNGYWNVELLDSSSDSEVDRVGLLRFVIGTPRELILPTVSQWVEQNDVQVAGSRDIPGLLKIEELCNYTGGILVKKLLI